MNGVAYRFRCGRCGGSDVRDVAFDGEGLTGWCNRDASAVSIFMERVGQ